MSMIMRKTLLGLAALTVATGVQARGGQEVTTEYYNDAAHTKLVGELIVGCGAHGRWGRTTAFSVHSTSPCDGARLKSANSIAQTSLLHHDPVAACKFRCSLLPLQNCPPPSSNQPECVQPRDACKAACDQLLNPPDE